MVAKEFSKSSYRSYVQLFVPTKDDQGKKLSKKDIGHWKKRAKAIFQKHVDGFYVSPYYIASGHYKSSRENWISEPNYIIKTYAPAQACRDLIKALEEEIIPQMGRALSQESIGLESSIEGFALYDIEDDGDE